MIAMLVRQLHGLRARVALPFVIGILIAAVGFFVMFMTLTRQWLVRELDFRGHALAARVAEDTSIPMLIGDRVSLQDEMHRAARESDVVGVGVYGLAGAPVISLASDSVLWNHLPWRAPARASVAPTRARWIHIAGSDLYEVVTPIRRISVVTDALHPSGDATELFGFERDSSAGASQSAIGYVRLVLSSARLEISVTAAERWGFALLLVMLGIGLLAAAVLVRVVVRPLREASELARGIAEGELTRRLPVRSEDELGALAESMNRMAIALQESQHRERDEAVASRRAAEAVIAIALGVRTANDPAGVFRLVAEQVRGITRCQGVALAVPGGEGGSLRLEHFDPAPPWGGLTQGSLLDPGAFSHAAGPGHEPVRLSLTATRDPFVKGLVQDGFRCALLVPLALTTGMQATLVLASREPDDFNPAQMRVVTGLASHLTSALSAAQLSVSLEQAFEDLGRTQEQLVRSEKLRATGEMASGVAHDFNNVLGAILARVQLMRREGTRGSLKTTDMLAALEVMELAARDGAETVRRLRQFGRGEEAPEVGPVDLADAARAAIEFTRPRWKDEAEAEGRSIEMTIDAQRGVFVVGLASELREVFTNLILNAADALPRGGRIQVSTSLRESRAVVAVEDDGIGMSADTRHRMFDPFFTTKGARGTGLGMSVVYGIIERLAGELKVTSQPMHGTRVEVLLPACADGSVAVSTPAPAAVVAPPVPGSDRNAPLRVLVVDDETPVRELLRDILIAIGHTPTAFESGEAALRDYVPGKYDLVLTDLGMPGMTGWQLAQSLRTLDPSVPIALVTGWGDEVEQAAAKRAGADAVVCKPFTIEDIEKLTLLARLGDSRDAA